MRTAIRNARRLVRFRARATDGNERELRSRHRGLGSRRRQRRRTRRRMQGLASSPRARSAFRRHYPEVPEGQVRHGDAGAPAAQERARLRCRLARGHPRHLARWTRGEGRQRPLQQRGRAHRRLARRLRGQACGRYRDYRRERRHGDRAPGQPQQVDRAGGGAVACAVSARRSRRIQGRIHRGHRRGRRRDRERDRARAAEPRRHRQPPRRVLAGQDRQPQPDPPGDRIRHPEVRVQRRARAHRGRPHRAQGAHRGGYDRVRPHHRAARRQSAAQVRRIPAASSSAAATRSRSQRSATPTN